MQNRYPLWKNILIIFILIVGTIYALPNIYPEKPSLQIGGTRGRAITVEQYSAIEKDVSSSQVQLNKAVFKDGKVLLVFENSDEQLKVATMLNEKLGSDFTVAITFTPSVPEWLTAIHAEPMKLGLDLRGGVRFLMDVEVDALINRSYSDLAKFINRSARDSAIPVEKVVYEQDKARIVATTESSSVARQLHDLINKTVGAEVLSEISGSDLLITYSPQKINQLTDQAINQSLEILRNRTTEIGVAEPTIQRQGNTNIVVELPGIQDVARAKEIIGATATLSFNLVNTSVSQSQIDANLIPADTMVVADAEGRPYALYKNDIITGSHIIDASASRGDNGGAQVNIRLNSEGATLISNATKSAIGQPLATVYSEYKDSGRKNAEGKPILRKVNEVANVATIQARLGSSFQITGLHSMAEANNLALILRSGVLVAPIQIISEKVIGPSLGADNIRQGIEASVYSLLVIIGLMIIVYRYFGFVAGLVLIYNTVLTIAVLSILPGTTLTLPGIAGLVLTIGMSVDANVLIYSRIIDELRAGRSPQTALSEGYNGAWSSIFDANLTTILTAIILFMFGTGPIKGFAITLAVGVIISMFTSIVASKMIFNFTYGYRRVSKLFI